MASPARFKVDRFGVVLVLAGGLAAMFMPLVVIKPNRIAAGVPAAIQDLLGVPAASVLLIVLIAAAVVALAFKGAAIRLAAAALLIVAACVCLGLIATAVLPDTKSARISTGGAFWAILGVGVLFLTDALVRLRPPPILRIVVLFAFAGFLALMFWSGVLGDLSVLREYTSRAPQFWTEAVRHVVLAFGSLFGAIVIGIPVGILCHWVPRVRSSILQTLSMIQTIPSIALFGLLMAPLGIIAATVPFAAEIGIRGIGVAPALIALLLYALLPVVANTVVGLQTVPNAVRDAAEGMGLTRRQVLTDIELPLAFPIILTGVRIVLVQNIGLVTVAALIGGGGFGAFVFQGINQTALDLVLLGAVPTVLMAFASAVILDAAVDAMRRNAA